MLTLGIDTGGTYTDAVLLDSAARQVMAKTKVFTAKHDLTRCIGDCIRALPAEMLSRITLVSLSTTLATNAVVEGDTSRVGLIVMGREPEGRVPVAMWRSVSGLLDIKGRVIHHVDKNEVAETAREFLGKADAMAVSGFASVRNPAHELLVRDVIWEILDLPVVCAHELSSSLGHYDRTVTAAINAGLITRIETLIQAVRACMGAMAIQAPLMVVRGDGSLIRDDAAMMRPIETILSGPAASIVGGLYLSGLKDALLLDMGGTTTDIAHAHAGKVSTNDGGAMVGGWRTMVRAADIATFGIGGDSRIALSPELGRLTVGPRRVQPFCVAGSTNARVAETLAEVGRLPAGDISIASQGTLYRLIDEPGQVAPPLETAVATLLREGPLHAEGIARALMVGVAELPLEEMRRKATLAAVSLTPTDILHVTGELALWDAKASRAGALVFARKMGLELDEFIERAKTEMRHCIEIACLESAVRFGGGKDVGAGALAHLVRGLDDDGEGSLVQAAFMLKKDIVAVGAPVEAWIPEVGERLRTSVVIPKHAEVANAVGAAVGQVRVRVEALVRPDWERKTYRVHAPESTEEFASRYAAEQWGVENALRTARERIQAWGGANAQVVEQIEPYHVVDGEGDPVYIETRITVEAVGNPSVIQA